MANLLVDTLSDYTDIYMVYSLYNMVDIAVGEAYLSNRCICFASDFMLFRICTHMVAA